MKTLLSLYRKLSYVFQSFHGAMVSFSIIALTVFCLCSTEANAQALTNPQTFSTPGTYTIYTVPIGVTTLTVECWGAGGGGSRKTGSIMSTSNAAAYSAAGAGGNYTKTTLSGLTAGAAVTVVVGSGGAEITAGNPGATTNGNPGGYSAVYQGSIIAQASGGQGGLNGGTGIGPAIGGGGGTLAGAVTPTITHLGGNSNNNTTAGNMSAGGGAGTLNDGGTPASGSTATGGAGGSVGGGAGGTGIIRTNGNPGNPAGGGGSGSRYVSGSATFCYGGSGAAGMVVITYTPCTNPVGTGVISGATSLCPATAGVAYSMSGISNVSAYSWSVSGTGNSVASGNGSSSITINWGNTSGTYTVTGTPQNTTICVGTPVNYSVVLLGTPASPASITAPSLICDGSGGTYTTPNLGFTYNWSVIGSGWSLNSANGSSSISIIGGSGNGQVNVTASNGCFTSLPKTTTFSSNPPPPNTPYPIVQY